MAGEFDIDLLSSVNTTAERADLALTHIEVSFDANWGVRAPNPAWLDGMIREKSDGRLRWRPVYSVSVSEGREFKGAIELSEGEHVFGPPVVRKLQQYGERAHIDKISVLDLDGWALAPARIQREIDKEPERVFARMLNFGHLIDDWTRSKFFVPATGTLKRANPRKKKYGTWFNALENQGAVPMTARLDAQFNLLNQVRGLDGEPLDLSAQKRYVFVPPNRYREVEKLLTRLELVPDNNGVAAGGGNTSRVWGDAIPVMVPRLRQDAIIVAVTPTDEQMMPFVRLRGTRGDGPPVPNTDVENIGGGVPEFETIIYDTSDWLYKSERFLGFARLHHRGYGLGSPHCMNISYDLLATATVNGVDYSALPSGGLY